MKHQTDISAVVGVLSAPDYALFVNHNNPDGQVHFNVYAPQKNGQDWGSFSIDTDSIPHSDTAVGPMYHDDVQGQHASANKVSKVKQSGAWDAVLLARLRFPPDSDRPTSVQMMLFICKVCCVYQTRTTQAQKDVYHQALWITSSAFMFPSVFITIRMLCKTIYDDYYSCSKLRNLDY